MWSLGIGPSRHSLRALPGVSPLKTERHPDDSELRSPEHPFNLPRVGGFGCPRGHHIPSQNKTWHRGCSGLQWGHF